MNTNYHEFSSKGFTLIELMVVIGIFSVLLAITLVALNPARQFAQANNTKRGSDTQAILNAIGQYSVQNSGNLPEGSGTNGGMILLSDCTVGSPCLISNDAAVLTPKIDLCGVLITDYLAELPIDPVSGEGTPTGSCITDYNTGYFVYQAASSNRITVLAPDTELQPEVSVISVTR